MLVSVITPTYNQSETLFRAAQSVFAQTYEPVEYVIVDDGSTDNTNDVVQQLDHPNLKYIELDQNQGVSTARNKGIEAASGRYVLFVDADDELQTSAISTLVRSLHIAPETCAGVFGRQRHYKDTGELSHSTYGSSEVRYDDLIQENCMGAFGGKLLRRRLFDEIGPIDTTFPSSEDFDFFLRTVANGYHFKYIDDPIYNKYHWKGQLSGNTTEKLIGMQRVLEKHGDVLTPQHCAHRMSIIGHIYATKNQMAEASDYFRGCISLCPFQLPYYTRYILARSSLYNYASDSKSVIRNLIG